MTFDYFTIQALAAEIAEYMGGRQIERAHTRGGQLAFGGRDMWCWAEGGRDGILCLREETWPRDWTAGDGAEKYLIRARIVDVESERVERILRLRLERSDRSGRASYGVLVCELIPNKIQFVLHREEGAEILGVWGGRKGSPAVGDIYQPPEFAGRWVPGADTSELWVAQRTAGGEELEKIARRRFAGADAAVVGELRYRAGGDQRLWPTAVEVYAAAIDMGGYAWEEGGRSRFSGLEPRRLQGACQFYDRISQAIWIARERQGAQRRKQRQIQQVRGRLKQVLKNSRRRLESMQRELSEAEQADDCAKKGNILLAYLDQVPGGLSQVELPDIYDPQGQATLCIALEPTRSAAENAARYLKAVKKYQRRQRELPPRLRELNKQCCLFERWLAAVEADAWRDDLALRDWLEHKGTRAMEQRQKAGPSAHPRRYRTTSGWSVWAGRNNKENDVLTHKMSAQNDLWFHAHGYPGSHVVLRREGRKEEPDKRALEEAAAVAAYWSKGKTAKKVSVVYTLVKYVTKPRGGAPGQALLKREKSLVVEPGLLAEDDTVA